jgi:hypothetical protein
MMFKWMRYSIIFHMMKGKSQNVYESLHSVSEITYTRAHYRLQKLVGKVQLYHSDSLWLK